MICLRYRGAFTIFDLLSFQDSTTDQYDSQRWDEPTCSNTVYVTLIIARLPFHLVHLNFETLPNTASKPNIELKAGQSVPLVGRLLSKQEGH